MNEIAATRQHSHQSKSQTAKENLNVPVSDMMICITDHCITVSHSMVNEIQLEKYGSKSQ
jgi:hypothetical protein